MHSSSALFVPSTLALAAMHALVLGSSLDAARRFLFHGGGASLPAPFPGEGFDPLTKSYVHVLNGHKGKSRDSWSCSTHRAGTFDSRRLS